MSAPGTLPRVLNIAHRVVYAIGTYVVKLANGDCALDTGFVSIGSVRIPIVPPGVSKSFRSPGGLFPLAFGG